MRLSILLLSLFSLVLVSCGGNKKADNDATADETAIEQADFDQEITGKYWKLIYLRARRWKWPKIKNAKYSSPYMPMTIQ